VSSARLITRFALAAGLLLLPAAAQSLSAQSLVREPRGPAHKSTPICANHHEFFSAALQRTMDYCLILPSDYDRNTTRSYSVLYLLHGLWGTENDWPALTKIADYVRDLPLIVVMPQGDDSWYVNAATVPQAKYEDYLLTDLRNEIETKYRAGRSRDQRFIAGLSMGGYGALKSALKRPDDFAAAGTFSGALSAARRIRLEITTPEIAFGPVDSPTRKQNDVLFLLAHADPAVTPYIFAITGENDPLFLDANREFFAAASKAHLKYEYHEVPGGHDWAFWDVAVKQFISAVIAPRLPK
jgi:S-formylglutathione hydrolase FrmB